MNKFSLSLDDYSPKPGTNDLTWANKLIEFYPDIKIDLFVPAAYARLGEKQHYLHLEQNWIDETKNLPVSNYRINLHGLYHRRSKKDFPWHTGIESNNNEWENLTYQQADNLLNKVEEEFEKIGLKHTHVFRSPGWHIGIEAVKLLIDRGYTIAGDDRYYQKYKSLPKLKWFSYNWDLLTEPLQGDIVAYGHSSDWNKNHLNEGNYHKIMKVLEKQEYEFRFIEEM